ncbi:MAG: hypothetical protein NTX24_01790 [Candidatus Pacearchaeota archaeon]|nr:hypothetical protein [Candidatus Pacearchaeota archaeon]
MAEETKPKAKIRVAVIEDGLRHGEIKRGIFNLLDIYIDIVASPFALHEIGGYNLILINPAILPTHKLGLTLERIVKTSPQTQEIAIIKHRPGQVKERVVSGKTLSVVEYRDISGYIKSYVDRKLAEANVSGEAK